jgi:hypothetical protein
MTADQTQAVTAEREAFEAWADDQGFPLRKLETSDDYLDLRTQGTWEAWQARAALSSPVAAQPADSAMEVLRELVACKDTEARLRQLHEMGHGTDWDQHRKQFAAAWDRARALTRQGDTA